MKKRCNKEQLNSKNQNSKIIYTPNEHIPIGEVVETDEGAVALEIKKPGKDKWEVITIDELLGMIYTCRGSVRLKG